MSTSTKIIGGLIVAIILSAASIAFLLFQGMQQELPLATPPKAEEEVVDDKYNFGINKPVSQDASPQGTLALSILPLTSTKDRPYLHLLDVQSDTSILDAKIPREGFSVGSQFVNESTYYAATESEESLWKRNDHYQIHYIDLASKTELPVQIGEGENERYLDWNEQRELLVYTRQVGGNLAIYEDMIDYKNNEVVIHDVKNNVETVVGNGGYGKWSPDGNQLLYMAQDGLRLYDVDTKNDRLVVNSRLIHNSTVTAVTMMDLSTDGNYLIWTTPHIPVLSLFKVTSWQPFAVEEIGRMSEPGVQYYWPTFSPDSNYYAIQAKDLSPSANPRTRIEIREIESREVVKSFSLDDFDFNKAFIDDWIE